MRCPGSSGGAPARPADYEASASQRANASSTARLAAAWRLDDSAVASAVAQAPGSASSASSAFSAASACSISRSSSRMRRRAFFDSPFDVPLAPPPSAASAAAVDAASRSPAQLAPVGACGSGLGGLPLDFASWLRLRLRRSGLRDGRGRRRCRGGPPGRLARDGLRRARGEPLLLAHAHVLLPAALVGAQRAVHHGDRPGADRLQQRAIMRDEQQRALEGLQRVLQRLAAFDVEVVRRLVEDEHVGARGDEDRQRQAPALAAAQPVQRLLAVLAAEEEAPEQRARLLRRQAGVDRGGLGHRARSSRPARYRARRRAGRGGRSSRCGPSRACPPPAAACRPACR